MKSQNDYIDGKGGEAAEDVMEIQTYKAKS
jgi:hypothetical protein